LLDVLETASLLERDSAGEREKAEVVAHAPANCRKGCAQNKQQAINLVTWQKV
jgi:hypothetical protein